jgi:hypothetical protein
MPHAIRVAENENVFRRVNERLEELGGAGGPISFFCECSAIDCRERIELTECEYEHVRAAPNRFVVRPGHERADVERIVERATGHVVIEKTGAAGAIVAADDPRG